MEQWSNLKSPISTPPLIVLDLVSLFPTFEIVWPLATVTLDQEKFKKDTSRLKLLVAEWNSAIIAASSQDRARGHELEYTKTLISTFNCRCRNLVADNKMAQKTNNSIDIDMEHLQFSQCLWDNKFSWLNWASIVCCKELIKLSMTPPHHNPVFSAWSNSATKFWSPFSRYNYFSYIVHCQGHFFWGISSLHLSYLSKFIIATQFTQESPFLEWIG